MCGFVGFVRLDRTKVDQLQVRRMTEVIRHRGPDDEGFYFDGPVGFGFRRLSILDLSPAGHQPMATADGKIVIVFNGEIYNFVELRRELEGYGHQFHSTGDTEVLLKAYIQWGTECVSHLNGMWAFLIHDQRRNVIFGSRDRFGIKPIFRFHGAQCVLFASEIKSILASGEYRAQTNWRVASDFLLRGRLDVTNESFYQDIVRVGAGCAFELFPDGKYREWQYWKLEDLKLGSAADPPAEYAALFEDAVRLHMRSDVPVGVHLSGGLDSSSIICSSARIRAAAGATDPLMAFCFTAPEYDESKYIDASLAQTGATPVMLKPNAMQLWDDLPSVLWYQDEPVHSMAAIVGFQLMRLTAASGLKVVLNGQGADETAAGYPSYFINYWHSLLRSGHWAGAWGEVNLHSRAHGRAAGSVFLKQALLLLRSHFARAGIYRAMARSREASRVGSNPWFAPEIAMHASPPSEVPTDRRLGPALARSVYREQLPLYLRVEDRNASAHSVEARVPFLDYRLVEFLFGLPDNWRLRGPWNKFVQREAMRGRIPEVTRVRLDKMGFPTPATKWFAGPLYEPLRDLLDSRTTRERGIYRVDALLADLDRHHRGEGEISGNVFDVAEFELWCRNVEGSGHQPAR